MSAIPSKADVDQSEMDVRFGPRGDMDSRSLSARLLVHQPTSGLLSI